MLIHVLFPCKDRITNDGLLTKPVLLHGRFLTNASLASSLALASPRKRRVSKRSLEKALHELPY